MSQAKHTVSTNNAIAQTVLFKFDRDGTSFTSAQTCNDRLKTTLNKRKPKWNGKVLLRNIGYHSIDVAIFDVFKQVVFRII